MNNLAYKTMGIFVIRTLESRRLCRAVRQAKIGETNAEYGILENAPPHPPQNSVMGVRQKQVLTRCL
jgi:hypothetical protein